MTVAVACRSVLSAAAARIVTGPAGTVFGAVYKPFDVIVPFALPPTTPQYTCVVGAPVTVAVNCCFAFVATVAVAGATVIMMPWPNSIRRGLDVGLAGPGLVIVM